MQNSQPKGRTATLLLAIELSEAGLELRDVTKSPDRPVISSRAQFVGTFEIDASWGQLEVELWSHTRRPYSDAEKQRLLTETREKVIKANAEEAEHGYPWDRADTLADHDALARDLYRNMRGSEPRMLLKRVVRLLFDEEELGVLLKDVKTRDRQLEDEAWLFDSAAWERLARERPVAS